MNKAFFVLPKGDFKRGEVLTTPTEKTDIKKPSNVIVSPIPVKRVDNDIHTTNDKKTPIKGLFIGANKNIPVHSFYISDNGDLIMFGTITRTREIVYDNPLLREVKSIHESFPISETISHGDYIISNQQYIKKELVANSGTITFIEPIYVDTDTDTDTEIEETVIRTRSINKALTGDVIELCEINYGYYRKHKVLLDTVFSYRHDNKVVPGQKTIYEGVLSCNTTNEQIGRDVIKQMMNIDKKAFVNFL